MIKITFEEEFKELCDWQTTETEIAFKIPWSGGLDGEGSTRLREITIEYNRRLRELKKKYNKE